ncbi:MAG: hypothetical protein WA324_18985 [Bryobacteraceae bacterium]
MIGDKTTTDIALGYEVRSYKDLTTEEKTIILDRLSKAIDSFAVSAKAAIKALKEKSSTSKANLEQTKDAKKPTMSDSEFSDYLFGKNGTLPADSYITQLRKIGVTAGTVMSDGALKGAVLTLNGELTKPVAATTSTPTIPTVTPTVPTPSVPTSPTTVTATSPSSTTPTYTYKAEIDETALEVVVKATGSGSEGTKEVTLLAVFTDSAEAYQEVSGATIIRKVYIKKGKNDYKGDDETQYVQDDAGIFTRRYCVMHKGKDVISALLDGGPGIVKGRLQGSMNVVTRTGGALAPDPEIYKVQPTDANRLQTKTLGDDLTLREMLHVHQELGSGVSGRGVCLTSISLSERQAQAGGWESQLKTIYANDGIPFKSNTTVLVLVDLARVPSGHDLLYNLYRPDAQAQSVDVKMQKAGPRRYNKKTKAYESKVIKFKDNQHMLDSVTKNRELFLRVLLRGYIANWPDVERELKPPTTVTPPIGTATAATAGVGTGGTKIT